MENNLDGQQQTEPTSQPQNKRTSKKPWAIWLLVILVLLLIATAGYLWWQLQNATDSKKALEQDKQQLQSQINKLNKANAQKNISKDTDVACNDTPDTLFKENIKAALDTENTAVFATYTSNPVKFVLAASEKGGDETPDEAALSLGYTHSATGPWDFSLPPATIANYDAGFYTDYFDANTYVGKAASGMVAAFDFDCNGKISQIFVAADEDLL